MATNKHASIRYQTLDRCFSNFGRRYFIEDLVNACCDALYEFEGKEDGVKRRQILDDIRYMQSEQGWSIPLEKLKEGKRVYYRYEDKNYSINNRGLNPTEVEQLKDTLAMLSRFRGMPQFDWIQEMQIRLQETFGPKNNDQVFVSFQANPFLKGLEHFTDLFNAMQNRFSLTITYKGYQETDPRTFTYHPWHLKQYNNRWFAFGWNDSENTLSNLPVDRIIKIQPCNIPYKPNTAIDFEEFFDDVVGVTVKEDVPVETVKLRISPDLWHYIESKPIHGSQKVKERTDEGVTIELSLQINYELRSLLFSFMDGVEILEPESLREDFRKKFKRVLKNYF